MNPSKGVEPPACGGGLDTFAFVVRKCGRMRLEGGANPGLQGCVYQQADGQHHQQCPDAVRLFEVEGGRQKLRGFEAAKPACRPGLSFVSIEHGLGG